MSEERQPSRRDFLKWVALGTVTGAGVGAGTYEPAPEAPRDRHGRKRPSIQDKLPPMLNTNTKVGHITSRAAAGGIFAMLFHTLIKRNSPPADTGRRGRAIEDEFHEGRGAEWHWDRTGRNVERDDEPRGR